MRFILICLQGALILRFAFYRMRTSGFKSRTHRADHFEKHRRRLSIPPGLLYEVLYERMADDFLSERLNGTSDEFTRRWNLDVVRFDRRRDVLACRTGGIVFVKSCYRPDPLVHGFPTNWDYYLSEKAKGI